MLARWRLWLPGSDRPEEAMNPILDDTDLALDAAQAITANAITDAAITAEADKPAAAVTTDEAPKSAPRLTGAGHAIASTLPTPPPSDPVGADGNGDAVTDEVAETVAAVKAIDAEVSEVVTSQVPEHATAITPDTPAKKAKRQAKRDLFAEQLRAEGLGPAVIAKLVVQREILHGRQRVHPTWRTVCSVEMVAFWATRLKVDGTTEVRTDEDIEADMIKLIRNDGGQVGPVERYRQFIAGSNPAAAAVAIADHVGQRIKSIRIYVCSAINELRRRRAVAAGKNEQNINYLAVAGT